MVKTYSLGTKNPDKIKKEVTIHLTKKHFIFAGVFFVILTFSLFKGFVLNPLAEDQLYFMCENKTFVDVEYNRTIYCGDHYNTTKGVITDATYKKVEDLILYNITNGKQNTR